MNEQYLQALSLYQRLVLSLSNLRLVHTSNANASASTNKHTYELPQNKRWKFFHFLSLAFALAFAFHTCEPGQRKGKRKMKDTRSMPLLLKFKPRWRQSLISFPYSSFPDCWSRVTRTLGTRLAPSWDTEMRVRNPLLGFCFFVFGCY